MKINFIKSLTKEKNKQQNLFSKVKNNSPVRVLYKKTNEYPQVKIIDNVYKLKKAIIDKKLDIVPYEHLFIICNSKKTRQNMQPNVYLPLNRIGGDLIVIQIDRKNREFKSLPQDDIIWFSQDLINKSSNNNTLKANTPTTLEKQNYYANLNNTTIQSNFEKDLIDVLISINITLSSILKHTKKGAKKNG